MATNTRVRYANTRTYGTVVTDPRTPAGAVAVRWDNRLTFGYDITHVDAAALIPVAARA